MAIRSDDLDEIRSVEVETGSMELVLRKARPTASIDDQSVRVEVRRAEKNRSGLLPDAELLTFPANKAIVIDGLQIAAYHVCVNVSGCARWERITVVNAKTKAIDVQLQPGGDVHIKALPENSNREISPALLQHGREVKDFYRDESDTYRGLPIGSYVLHIPSAKELHSGGLAGEDNFGPDEIDHAGRDIAFVISENSPALVDLGEIRLSPIRK